MNSNNPINPTNPNPYLTTSFSYTDEYGETTTLTKTHEAETQEDPDIYFLTEQFKSFLSSIGYAQKWVDRVVYLDDNEEVITKEISQNK